MRRRRTKSRADAVGIVIGSIAALGFLLCLTVVFVLHYSQTAEATPRVTSVEYESVDVGMDYRTVRESFGMAGEQLFAYRADGAAVSVDLVGYGWRNPDGTKIMCVFSAGGLSTKFWIDGKGEFPDDYAEFLGMSTKR